jgi:hypothetical protein
MLDRANQLLLMNVNHNHVNACFLVLIKNKYISGKHVYLPQNHLSRIVLAGQSDIQWEFVISLIRILLSVARTSYNFDTVYREMAISFRYDKFIFQGTNDVLRAVSCSFLKLAVSTVS